MENYNYVFKDGEIYLGGLLSPKEENNKAANTALLSAKLKLTDKEWNYTIG